MSSAPALSAARHPSRVWTLTSVRFLSVFAVAAARNLLIVLEEGSGEPGRNRTFIQRLGAHESSSQFDPRSVANRRYACFTARVICDNCVIRLRALRRDKSAALVFCESASNLCLICGPWHLRHQCS
jgi:hypothetical protein